MTSPLRILIAPDKFKGTLTGLEAAEAMAAGASKELPSARIEQLPIADGGEGTVDAVVGAGGRPHSITVHGPCGDDMRARWVSTADWAVVEFASASGLQLLEPTSETALAASSFGTGQMIRDALDHGYSRIAVGLGGSASTDGGTGALHALGARFFDAGGNVVVPSGGTLTKIRSIDLGELDTRLSEAEIVVCCDVESPMIGPDGAAAVYGPQKGATRSGVATLEQGLANLAEVLRAATGRDPAAIGWGGAAGASAGGLYAVLGARYQSGFDTVAGFLDLDARLGCADLVIVGEGKLDSQSLSGKAPIALARRSQAMSVPVLAVAGVLDVSMETLSQFGVRQAVSATEEAGSSPHALENPGHWVGQATRTALRRHLASC